MMSARRDNPYKWKTIVGDMNKRQGSQQVTRRQKRRRTWVYIDQYGNEIDEDDIEYNHKDESDDDDDENIKKNAA